MDQIETVRAFNRFYTQFAGALDTHFLGSDLSLPEARLLYEIARADGLLAGALATKLGMDTGFVSRVVARFEKTGLIERPRESMDARRRPIRLTDTGRAAFAELDRRQRAAVVASLDPLSPAVRILATDALAEARSLIEQRPAGFAIRPFRPGDMGLIASRQAVIYHDGWGWGRPMEILLGEVTTDFLRGFDAAREQCWIGEIAGRMAGSIFCTASGTPGLAKLRLLYVEAFARGLGLGEALVDTCIAFARDAGYDAIELWTHTILTSARRIYAAKDFALMRTEMHGEFGEPVQGEFWRLEL